MKFKSSQGFSYQKYLPIFFWIVQVAALILVLSLSQSASDSTLCKQSTWIKMNSSTQPTNYLYRRGKHQSVNFKAKFLHGNIRKGVKNIHLNVRSLYTKMGEVRLLAHKEKPHILGISEAELRKGACHNPGILDHKPRPSTPYFLTTKTPFSSIVLYSTSYSLRS